MVNLNHMERLLVPGSMFEVGTYMLVTTLTRVSPPKNATR